MSEERWRCSECLFIGRLDQYEKEQRKSITMYFCPKCDEPNTVESMCDEPGCPNVSTCGLPTPEGYKWICGKHYADTYKK